MRDDRARTGLHPPVGGREARERWGTLAATSLVIGGLPAGKWVGVLTTLGFAVAFTIHVLD
jgi:hypothetical protein